MTKQTRSSLHLYRAAASEGEKKENFRCMTVVQQEKGRGSDIE